MPFFILFSGSRKCWWPKVGKKEWKKGTQQQAVTVASSEATRKKISRNGFIYLRANGNQTTIYEIYWLLNYLFSFNEWKGRKMKGCRRLDWWVWGANLDAFSCFWSISFAFFPFCYFSFFFFMLLCLWYSVHEYM